MAGFKVFTDQLRQCASSLDGLEQLFNGRDGLDAVTASARDAVGDNDVADRLGRFEEKWGSRKKRLLTDVAGITKALRDAADSYDNVDDAVKQPMPGPRRF